MSAPHVRRTAPSPARGGVRAYVARRSRYTRPTRGDLFSRTTIAMSADGSPVTLALRGETTAEAVGYTTYVLNAELNT